MKFRSALVPLFLLLLTACDDDNATVPNGGEDTFATDRDIDAPIVNCADAFTVYDFRIEPLPTTGWLTSLVFNDNGLGFATNNDRDLYRVTNDGESWEPLPDLPELPDLNFVGNPVFATNDLLFVTRGLNFGPTFLLSSTDGGTSFDSVGTFPLDSASIVGLHFTSATSGSALAQSFKRSEEVPLRLLKTNDGGVSWTSDSLPTASTYGRFVEIAGQTAIKTGAELLFPTRSDAFDSYPFPTFTRNSEFTFDGENAGIVSDFGNKLYRTTDAGRNWTETSLPQGFFLNHLFLEPNGTGLAIGARYDVIGGDALSFKGLLLAETTDFGASWTVKKTTTDCGYRRTFFRTPTRRLVSTGRELVLLTPN